VRAQELQGKSERRQHVPAARGHLAVRHPLTIHPANAARNREVGRDHRCRAHRST